jgi:diguanylate cyclase (GGDEF)-like protein
VTTAPNHKPTLADYFYSLSRPLGAIVILFGGVSLLGYMMNAELLYRPFSNAPATNPLTAICLMLSGICLYCNYYCQRWLLLLITLICGTVLISHLLHQRYDLAITPFQATINQQLADGKANMMGFNTALMLLCTSLAIWLTRWHSYISAQLSASMALIITFIAFVGYGYRIDAFINQMSYLTATIGTVLTFAILGQTANKGAMQALLSPYIAGRIGRLHLLVSLFAPLLLGYFPAKYIIEQQSEVFGSFVILICWFSVVMVGTSAVIHERIDRQRRASERHLAHAAITDPLTGLYNRRKFIEVGNSEIKRLSRNQGESWLLMVDIDDFKHINDSAGHETGDKILVLLAQALQQSVRSIDIVSRIGGEEFAIFLFDTDRLGAAQVADKLRRCAQEVWLEQWQNGITISVGCSSSKDAKSFEQLFRLADTALYDAKNSGKNTVVFSAPAAS